MSNGYKNSGLNKQWYIHSQWEHFENKKWINNAQNFIWDYKNQKSDNEFNNKIQKIIDEINNLHQEDATQEKEEAVNAVYNNIISAMKSVSNLKSTMKQYSTKNSNNDGEMYNNLYKAAQDLIEFFGYIGYSFRDNQGTITVSPNKTSTAVVVTNTLLALLIAGVEKEDYWKNLKEIRKWMWNSLKAAAGLMSEPATTLLFNSFKDINAKVVGMENRNITVDTKSLNQLINAVTKGKAEEYIKQYNSKMQKTDVILTPNSAEGRSETDIFNISVKYQLGQEFHFQDNITLLSFLTLTNGINTNISYTLLNLIAYRNGYNSFINNNQNLKRLFIHSLIGKEIDAVMLWDSKGRPWIYNINSLVDLITEKTNSNTRMITIQPHMTFYTGFKSIDESNHERATRVLQEVTTSTNVHLIVKASDLVGGE